MRDSNFSPSEDDGIIDHDLEAAIEYLVDQINTVDDCYDLVSLLPGVREIRRLAFEEGEIEGRLNGEAGLEMGREKGVRAGLPRDLGD